MTLLIGYASTAAAVTDSVSPWYLDVLLVLLILAAISFVITGIIYIFQNIHKAVYPWRYIMRIQLHSPIGLRKRSSKEIDTAIPEVAEAIQHHRELTQEELVERHAFIRQLQAVAEQLCKNSQGADNRSIISILHDICNESPVKEHNARDNMSNQATRLLTNQLNDLFSRASDYYSDAEVLSPSNIDNAKINALCNTTRYLMVVYCTLVDEVMIILKNLEIKGVEPIWNKSPWSLRIHKELADSYDELMRLVVDLKTATPKGIRDLLPTDDRLSRFPRALLWS